MITAIILAAGKGERLNANIPKPFVKLLNTPIIVWSTKVFNEHTLIKNIIIVTLKEYVNYCKTEIVDKYKLNKVTCVLAGGEKRQDSARLGIMNARTETIIIHDAARPLVDTNLITQLIETQLPAVIPVIPLSNTIKIIDHNQVVQTLNRNNLYETQAPQLFDTNIIKLAHLKAYQNGVSTTDDASLVEYIGEKVFTIPGPLKNIKITTPTDLLLAELLLKSNFELLNL